MNQPAALHFANAHRLDAALALGTFLFGMVGIVLVAASASRAGMVSGGIGVALGLWGQMVSRTRSERFFDVSGLVAAAVAFAIGASQSSL